MTAKYCNKRTFNVIIKEVHCSHRRVVAASPEEAIEYAGDGEETYLEFSHTLGKDTWLVEEENSPPEDGHSIE